MTILWLKAFHVFFMIAWMAGIFYLPRLFVYHAESTNQETKDQFKIMERRLWFFVTPFALLTLILGVIIMYLYGSAWLKVSAWLHAKLAIVALFYAYHMYLYRLVKVFAADKNTHSPRFYRFLNEVPVLALLAIVILAILKPF
ncbi:MULTISPECIES: protoporphyrinogen oxidase HemJ [Alteromonadaceae]|jgi:putative membrane protein|uniref:Protoporphyrinogen IX oxidase n=1 Tax=Brumicola blandensis TaxID=3075611 RepID=A0AAW8R2P0_9ALTE|nr:MULTISPECIES: protoporphyrinogen oxidase HemJ [unclassified Alteromonas]MDT0582368.1 protoporphyrinogen oxidase HemJ [Alteromonas sp. W409]MDT0628590.1 protoporphyrinogen oxidase HemJ [Alteromonas sp. W364]